MKRESGVAYGDNDFRQGKPITNAAACLSPASHSLEFPSIHGVGSVGGVTIQDPGMVDRIKRGIVTTLLIISTLFSLHTFLQLFYTTFIQSSFSHSYNFFVFINGHLFKS